MNKIYFSMLVVILLASCSMEKQLYSKGFHIEWNSSLKSKTEIAKKDTTVLDKKIDKQKKLVSAISTKKVAKVINKSEKIIEVENKKDETSTVNNSINKTTSNNSLNSTIKENKLKKLEEKILSFKTKKTKSAAPNVPKRKMHILTKLALILIGLGLIMLIVGFWTWYFSLITAVEGTTAVATGTSLYATFFIAGLISLFTGLALLIVRWIAS